MCQCRNPTLGRAVTQKPLSFQGVFCKNGSSCYREPFGFWSISALSFTPYVRIGKHRIHSDALLQKWELACLDCEDNQPLYSHWHRSYSHFCESAINREYFSTKANVLNPIILIISFINVFFYHQINTTENSSIFINCTQSHYIDDSFRKKKCFFIVCRLDRF